MSKKNLILCVAVILMNVSFLALTTGMDAVSLAGDTPPPFPMFGTAGICTDQQYLYAVAGGQITEYTLADMSLVKTVTLPKPAPPSDASASLPAACSNQSGTCPPPPLFAGSQRLLVSGGYLYVMMGPMVYQYSIPDLVLQNSVELPKPALQ